MTSYQSYVFNFSASYFGGGLKRILAYLKWFDERGGACFILNYRLKEIEKTFPHNRYCFLKSNAITKVFNYSPQFNQFISTLDEIKLYYSYNIPLKTKIGKVNWLHIANVLPFVNSRKYVSFRRSLELKLLGLLIKRSMRYADVISAESTSSLSLLNDSPHAKFIVSVNGSDEEISTYHQRENSSIHNIAVAVGTCQYKRMDDVYKIYLYLRNANPDLQLIIAGIKEDVPSYIQRDSQVILRGVLPQKEVCLLLKNAKYYITATQIENSYNAASEGMFFTEESFVSDIGPHRELLHNVNYKVMDNLGTPSPFLYVNKKDLNVNILKSWDQIIQEMIQQCIRDNP